MPDSSPVEGPLDRAVEIYDSVYVLRAGAAAIPFVGGSIDALITTRASKLAAKRIAALFEEMKSNMARIKEAKLDKEFLESDAWDDLILRALNAAAATSDYEKTRLYAAILAGSTTVQGIRSELDPAAILSAISELSVEEIVMARSIFANTFSGTTGAGDTDFHLNRLERSGLIKSTITSGFGGATKAYQVTSTFARLMGFLSNPST
jgi:hypothetical protein